MRCITNNDQKQLHSKNQSRFPASLAAQICPSPAWWPLRGAQTRSHPELGRQTPQRRWYYVSRPGRVGRSPGLQKTDKTAPLNDKTKPKTAATQSAHAGYNPAKHPDAGWSSPVARQAHNLKVTGSNPVPATSVTCDPPAPLAGRLLLSPSARIPARSPAISICSWPSSGTSRISSISPRSACVASARSSGRFSSSCRLATFWR